MFLGVVIVGISTFSLKFQTRLILDHLSLSLTTKHTHTSSHIFFLHIYHTHTAFPKYVYVWIALNPIKITSKMILDLLLLLLLVLLFICCHCPFACHCRNVFTSSCPSIHQFIAVQDQNTADHWLPQSGWGCECRQDKRSIG